METMGFFDGFPYLVTRIVAALRHIILLPADIGEDELRAIAVRQVTANRLPTCLVLGPRRAVYYEIDGRPSETDSIPRGIFAPDRLQPAARLVQSHELLARKERLAEWVEAQKRAGFIMGDLTKGGRDATPDELVRLAGWVAPRVPKGLVLCEECGEWRGECLDPNPVFRGKLMKVHCRCENDNRCARCGMGLYEYKLNANYFDPVGGQIWHVPGFCAFDHKCWEVARQAG